MTKQEAIAAIDAAKRVYATIASGECKGQIIRVTPMALDRDELTDFHIGATAIPVRKA